MITGCYNTCCEVGDAVVVSVLFVSDLRPFGLNVLGYQSNRLKCCPPVCGDKGFSLFSTLLAFEVLSRSKFSTFASPQNKMLEVFSRSHASRYGSQNKISDFVKNGSLDFCTTVVICEVTTTPLGRRVVELTALCFYHDSNIHEVRDCTIRLQVHILYRPS